MEWLCAGATCTSAILSATFVSMVDWPRSPVPGSPFLVPSATLLYGPVAPELPRLQSTISLTFGSLLRCPPPGRPCWEGISSQLSLSGVPTQRRHAFPHSGEGAALSKLARSHLSSQHSASCPRSGMLPREPASRRQDDCHFPGRRPGI